MTGGHSLYLFQGRIWVGCVDLLRQLSAARTLSLPECLGSTTCHPMKPVKGIAPQLMRVEQWCGQQM